MTADNGWTPGAQHPDRPSPQASDKQGRQGDAGDQQPRPESEEEKRDCRDRDQGKCRQRQWEQRHGDDTPADQGPGYALDDFDR
jgi:hypothetical protein